MAEQLRGPFEKSVDSPYYSESRLRGGAVTVFFFEVLNLASDALLTTLHPLLQSFRRIVKQAVLSRRTFQTALYMLHHPNKGSFETTVTENLTTVRGMKITPLLRYPPTITTWHKSHCLHLCITAAHYHQSTNFFQTVY